MRVLTWADVDLDAGLINVTKAWDYTDEKVKPPKTRNGVRRVPIEANVAPLLRALQKGKQPSDVITTLLDTWGEKHLADRFRAHLTTAGITRPELHKSTRTHVQSNFRSCRDSGITWLAMAGLGVDKIMRRAGHDDGLREAGRGPNGRPRRDVPSVARVADRPRDPGRAAGAARARTAYAA